MCRLKKYNLVQMKKFRLLQRYSQRTKELISKWIMMVKLKVKDKIREQKI
jgi:hypothetical protein